MGNLVIAKELNQGIVVDADLEGVIATGGGEDKLFRLNAQVMTADYTIPAGQNAMVVGNLEIPTGVTLTVSTGSKLVVL